MVIAGGKLSGRGLAETAEGEGDLVGDIGGRAREPDMADVSVYGTSRDRAAGPVIQPPSDGLAEVASVPSALGGGVMGHVES